MAERSFSKEVQSLTLGDGEIFRGEGILAVTKALLQSGVSYVGGYQGAPVSHLLDVMVEAEELLAELGVHVETCTNEAAAAAMLGASINYPLRGAVTWKSIVGTNVAADALSSLSSPGVMGGVLIVLGEDYGEGASVVQERSYAYALKSSMWLLDPRPDLPTIVRMVEQGFELSEASHAPVMLELRVRACHVTGEFVAKANRRAAFSCRNPIPGPPRFVYDRLAHPPVLFVHERLKVEQRLPAACAFIREHKLNEFIPGDLADIGIVVCGGLTNGVLRALERLGLADLDGTSRVPVHVLNCVYPLLPEEVRAFCGGKRTVLVVEEGSPEYIEQQINVELRRADIQTRVMGKDVLPKSGDYGSEVLLKGLAAFVAQARPAGIDADTITARVQQVLGHMPAATASLADLPARPPTFCTGCPERPVFSAIKLMQRELGPTHIAGDIGCHAFATFQPFSLGNSILGYGMSLASAAAVTPNLDRRPIAVMGDGGFWHNGLITGVTSNLFNKNDGVLIVMQNGYASATGQQWLPSSGTSRQGVAPGMDIETTLRALGVKWLRKVRTYSVAKMTATLKEAMRTAEQGLKVIIADGECQLARQRRVRAEDAEKLKRGERVVKTRYGVDDAICTGDHSCIRLSGCPSLTVKPNPDPLRSDPVATVIESCVGCGLCGEVAHAAVLCPSFYRAEVVRNPNWWDRVLHWTRSKVIGLVGGTSRATSSPHGRRAPSPLWGEGGGEGVRSNRETVTPHPAPLPMGEGADRALGATVPQASKRPITLLIAALGGEGGGVLTDWIVRAAEGQGFPVQSTSIPGVAQRTGATTYYIEIIPAALPDGAPRPVLALAPGIGDVDMLVASELMEAGRAVASGFVTPDRTLAIASTSRFFVMGEKVAMGDGRYDSERLARTIEENSEARILIDMEAVARRTGAFINSVMLGVIAGSGRLPIPVEAFQAAIRGDGKGVDGNLRGFRAGLEAAQDVVASTTDMDSTTSPAHPRESGDPGPHQNSGFATLDSRLRGNERGEGGGYQEWPEIVRDVIAEGVRRLTDYQDAAYARLYLDRLARIRDADARASAESKLLRETARHLALRMSYEDLIRVAQAKTDPARLARIAGEVQAKPGEPLTIAEFLKPGIDEVCSVLPPALARRILSYAESHPRLAGWHWGMELNTVSVSGWLRLRTLARLRRFRPRTHRYIEEQGDIERWLGLIVDAAALSPELALEIAECACLIKGYGDTHKRGSGNYRQIEAHVIRPALAGRIPLHKAADAVASARTAALVDPDGESLAQCLTTIGTPESRRVAAE